MDGEFDTFHASLPVVAKALENAFNNDVEEEQRVTFVLVAIKTGEEVDYASIISNCTDPRGVIHLLTSGITTLNEAQHRQPGDEHAGHA